MARYQVILDIEYDSDADPDTVGFMVSAALDVAKSPLRVMTSTAKVKEGKDDDTEL